MHLLHYVMANDQNKNSLMQCVGAAQSKHVRRGLNHAQALTIPLNFLSKHVNPAYPGFERGPTSLDGVVGCASVLLVMQSGAASSRAPTGDV
jgi:hypothetical protein